MADKLTSLGDIKIKTLAITSENATLSVYPQMLSMNIYSDIFGKWIHGELILQDVQNLQSIFPLVGKEILSVSFETPSVDVKFSKDFFIYKMSEKTKLGREDVYCLYFISPEAIACKNIKISKTFRGNPVDMIKDIFSKNYFNRLSALFGETPKNRFTYISNFWDITKNIDYICEHSVSENDSPTFLFYETPFGFHFNSLDTLMSDKNSSMFVFELSEYENRMQGKDNAVTSRQRDYMQVQEVYINNGFNWIDRVESGFYGGRMLTYDIVTGRYVEKQIKIETKNPLNANDAVPNYYSSANNYALFVMTPKAFNNIDDSGDNTNSDYKILREGLFSRMRNTRITIKVFGRADYAVGMKAKLNIAKSGVPDKDDWDEYLSGNFLITGVKHEISRSGHYSILELSKDSFKGEILKESVEDYESD